MQLDSPLERIPTEILIKIIKSLRVSDVSIAFTCPRMYDIFKDVFPRPISLCNTGVVHHIDHLDPYQTKKVHVKLQKYSPILKVYNPKDYIYRVMTRVSEPAAYDLKQDIWYQYQHYGRFLRRPYYDDEENCTYLREQYRNFELYKMCWYKHMPEGFSLPNPHNKGRIVYDKEIKEAVRELIDTIEVVTPEVYRQRLFFLKQFLKIGSTEEVDALVTANRTLKYYSQWREMIGF